MTEQVFVAPQEAGNTVQTDAVDGGALSSQSVEYAAVAEDASISAEAIDIKQSTPPADAAISVAQVTEASASLQNTTLSSTALSSDTVAASGRQLLQLMLPEAQLSKLMGSLGNHHYSVTPMDSSGLLQIEGEADAIKELLELLPDYLSDERQGIVLRDGVEGDILGRYIFEPESGHLVSTTISPIGGGASAFAIKRFERLAVEKSEIGSESSELIPTAFSKPVESALDNLVIQPSELLARVTSPDEAPAVGVVMASTNTEDVRSGTNDTEISTGSGNIVSILPTEDNTGNDGANTIESGSGGGGPAPSSFTNTVAPTVVGTGIVDRMMLQTAAQGTGFSISSFFTDADLAAGDSVTYSIAENTIYGTGDPSAWAAADFLTLDAGSGYLYTNRALLAGDRGVVYLTIRATDRGGLTADESLELFVADAGVISGTTGDDNPLNGTAGADWVWGDEGEDTVDSDGDLDYVHGGEGNDSLDASTGSDFVYGGQGNDTIKPGTGASNYVYAGDGDDSVVAPSASQTVYAGAGSDTVSQSSGTDATYLQSGNDLVYYTNASGTFDSTDTLSGGSGLDTLRLTNANTNALVADFSNGNWENVSGIETFDLQANAAHSLTFNDEYITRGGFEGNTLTVDASSIATGVTIDAQGITDSNYELNMTGGSGNDSMYAALAILDSNDSIDGGGGTSDRLYLQTSTTASIDFARLTNVNNIERIHYDSNAHITMALSDAFESRNNVSVYSISNTNTVGGKIDGSLLTSNNFYAYIYGTNDYHIIGSTGTSNDRYHFESGGFDAGDTIEGGSATLDVFRTTTSGSSATIINTSSMQYISGVEQFTVRTNHTHNFVFNDGYFTRGTNIASNNIIIEYAFSGAATNGMLVDGRLMTNSSYTLTVTGDEAADTVYGGAGADTIDGMNGTDYISAGEGNDSIFGRFHADTIYGGDGSDTINGGDGNDILSGDDGNDFIEGTSWSDRIIGGYGVDTLWGGSTGSHGTGTNSFLYNDPNESMTTETDIIKDFGAGGDDDKLLIYGFTGIQVAAGAAAAGTVLGWTNNTDDTGNGQNDIVITSAINNFKLVLEGAGTGADNITLVDNTNIFFNAAARTEFGLGAISGSYILGTGGNDAVGALTGTVNDDYILGLEGDDTVSAAAGDDTIYSGDGADSIDAGDGDDLVYGGDGADILSSTTGGNDTLYGGAGADTINVTYVGSSRNIIVDGGEGDDTITLGSNTMTIYGGGGDDHIVFDNGYKVVFGGDGDDYISPSSTGASGTSDGYGGDTLYGGDGSDSLDGGVIFGPAFSSANRDHLYGGAGDDYFIFNTNAVYIASTTPSAPSSRDVIYDFSGSAGDGDKIDLSSILPGSFSYLGAIVQADSATVFAADNSVRYYQDSGGNKTIIQATYSTIDADPTTIDMEIELTGLITLTAGDFVL